jgi:hypothetical protein
MSVALDTVAPKRYAQCLALKLGISRPCWWYRCRFHLGLNVRPDGSLVLLIPPDEIADAPETCALAAARRERSPEETADILHVSIGLIEYVQRHSWANARAALDRVRDVGRGVAMDISGLPDARGQRTAWPRRQPRPAARRPEPPKGDVSALEMCHVLDRCLERLRQGTPWRRLTREQAAATFGADRLHPDYGGRNRHLRTGGTHSPPSD